MKIIDLKSFGEFNRNFITLASGAVVAQAIPIAISPILTRLYSPSEFGVFSLYLAIVSVFGCIASARYDMAIMLPEKHSDALIVAFLSAGIATFFSLVLLVFFLTADEMIYRFVGDRTLEPLIIWIPFAVWVFAIGTILSTFCSRAKRFKVVATYSVCKSLSAGVVHLAAGFSKFGLLGLVFGNLAAGLVFLFGLNREIKLTSQSKRHLTYSSFIGIAKKYSDFPKYSMGATLVNGLSLNIVYFMMSAFYSFVFLGYYGLVQRVLSAPSSVLGGAVGQVLYQQGSVEFREYGCVIKSFDEAFKKLLLISLLPFSLICLFAEPIFTIIFGSEWSEAGRYAEILAPLFWIRFIVSPLSVTNQILLKNRFGLIANIVLFFISTIVIGFGAWLSVDVDVMLGWMSASLSCFYFVFFLFLYFGARSKL